MAKSRIESDLHVAGIFTATQINLPSGTVENSDIAGGAGVDATKLQQQHSVHYAQADGSDVAAETMPIYTCRGATATIIAVQAVTVDAPSGGGTEEITVDLQKYDQVTPTPATVLDAPISITDSEADGEVVAGTITGASLVAGESLLVIVNQTGSGGTKGQGLGVTVTIREDPE